MKAAEILSALPDAWTVEGARYRHEPSGTSWVYVPGQRFVMGLTAREEAAARSLEDPPPLTLEEMRPAHEREVAGFLCMAFPVSWGLVERVLPGFDRAGRLNVGGADSGGPAFVTRAEAEAVCGAFGLALPTEAQWECACRGGTDDLFFFGDTLPEESELESLVTTDWSRSRPNPFGLHGLFVGEWCRDVWSSSHASAGTDPGVHVVRGGGSLFWPWQASEWAYCVSSFRMPSTDVIDGLAGMRMVYELPLGRVPAR